MRVSSLDSLDVSFHRRSIVRRTGLELNRAGQIRILDLLVALEKDVIDNRTLANIDDERATGLVDANVREQPHREQTLHRSINIGAGEGLARANLDVVTDGLRVDASVTAHLDTANDSSLGNVDRSQRECSST